MVTDMIYDHLVKYNGKYYQAGEEVPNDKEPLSSAEELDDADITLEIDSAVNTKSSVRRGRPKKSE